MRRSTRRSSRAPPRRARARAEDGASAPPDALATRPTVTAAATLSAVSLAVHRSQLEELVALRRSLVRARRRLCGGVHASADDRTNLFAAHRALAWRARARAAGRRAASRARGGDTPSRA